jgi:hypothetical protein
MERETGFEPATSTLARSHSTTELFPLATNPNGNTAFWGQATPQAGLKACSYEPGGLEGQLLGLYEPLPLASRSTFAAVSGGVGLRWRPVAHSNAPNRVTLGRISMCQW